MKPSASVLVCLVFVLGARGDVSPNVEGEQKIADKIMDLLEHYKQDDPIGIPGVEIPDPMTVPKTKQKVSGVDMTLENMKIYGISKFRIVHIKSQIAEMKVNAAIEIKNLHVNGNYTMLYWFQRSKGPFTIEITNLNVEGVVSLGIERDGKLRAQDVEMDITFENMQMNFQNLGLLGSIFQGILNSLSSVLFNSIKPFVLKEAYAKIREEVNMNLEKHVGDMQFPNSISPLDMLIGDTRNKVRNMKMDPHQLKDYNITKDFYKAYLRNTWLMGVSSFYRVGNVSVSMINNTAVADFEVGTQRLSGRTEWELTLGGLVSRYGTASLSVEYIHARFVFAQPLDTRKRLVFRDFDLDVGNIQVRCDGVGTLDYAVELLVNVLPNLLRYQIIDGIEGPIREKVQERLDQIDVEQLVKEKVSTLDDAEMDAFKLSSLKNVGIPSLEEIDDEEFWKREMEKDRRA